ncbi:mannose-6-phosphate isomerase, class I [Desertivibrio insolitus]|uniref:mannose-6-phosphate isomerase, class I n=1 Tax=Herbiconiux sp. SYSU D00978 TaxID=2812562 RepID=UPI001A9636EE|nr:mannose-6-phosphate isomerase, class I [Herbiconiux sp. SYSU D00978]
MFVGITNTPRPFDWGSHTAIAELLGRLPSGAPEAELWLGAHPGSPSVLHGGGDLASWLEQQGDEALGSHPRLPFLLKVLAAESALSLQAHPSPEQARAGFERENAAGVPIDAPHRNYRDPYAKPELIVAVSDRFEALAGFRDTDDTRLILDHLLEADAASAEPRPRELQELRDRLGDLRDAFAWLATRGPGVTELVERVSELVVDITGGPYAREFETVRELAAKYPGDPGVVGSLLLNRVTLARGEALYLPAGNIHAYLHGLGIELMSASDNVLRGGLTPKHVDVDELLEVLDFRPLPAPYLEPEIPAPGIRVFRPDVPDFVLAHISLVPGGATDAGYELTGPAIALCTHGTVELEGATSSLTLERGDAVFITPDEAALTFEGAGTVYLATTGA